MHESWSSHVYRFNVEQRLSGSWCSCERKRYDSNLGGK